MEHMFVVLIISVPVLLKLKQPLVRYSIVATGWVLSILVHSSYSTTTASETLLILMKGLVLSMPLVTYSLINYTVLWAW